MDDHRAVTELTTNRLLLRVPRASDLDALARILADPEVTRFLGSGRPLERSEAEQSLANMIHAFEVDGFGLFAVERRDDGELLGRAGLLPWDPATWTPSTRAELGQRAEIEIGWTLARERWGKGYATEAALAIRDWALGTLRLNRLVSLIQPGNTASIRVAEKLGERLEREIETGGGQRALLYALER